MRNAKRVIALSVVGAVAAVMSATSLAAPNAAYTIIDLGVLHGGTSSAAMGVNAGGVVAGYVPTKPDCCFTHAALWQGKKIVDLNGSLQISAGATEGKTVANPGHRYGGAGRNLD